MSRVFQTFRLPRLAASAAIALLACSVMVFAVVPPAQAHASQASAQMSAKRIASGSCEFVNVYGYTNHKIVYFSDGDSITVTTYLEAYEEAQGQYCGQMQSYSTFTCTLCTHTGTPFGGIVYKTSSGSYTSAFFSIGEVGTDRSVSIFSPAEVTSCAAAEAKVQGGSAGYIEVGTANYCD